MVPPLIQILLTKHSLLCTNIHSARYRAHPSDPTMPLQFRQQLRNVFCSVPFADSHPPSALCKKKSDILLSIIALLYLQALSYQKRDRISSPEYSGFFYSKFYKFLLISNITFSPYADILPGRLPRTFRIGYIPESEKFPSL